MKEKDKRYITLEELEYMRMKLDKVRSKEHEQDMRAIGGIISLILGRSEEDEKNNNKV